MKDYNRYMDGITADAGMRNRILERLERQAPPNRTNRVLARYAGLAACAVVLTFGVWILPGLLTDIGGLLSPPEIVRPHELPGTPADPGAVNREPAEHIAPNDPTRPAIDIHALTFNTGGRVMSGSHLRIQTFALALTGEQFDAVFPNLHMPLAAYAHYHRDGTLYEVVAYVNDHLFSVHVAEGIIFRPVVITHDIASVDIDNSGMLFTVSMVHGVEVTAHYAGNYHEASFVLGDAAYLIQIFDGGEHQVALMTEIVNRLILGDPADLSILADPVIPELRDENLTFEQAVNDPDFGIFLPQPHSIPPRFRFESAHRHVSPQSNALQVLWSEAHTQRSFDSLTWRIEKITDDHRARLVSPVETEKYDMSLYPIPWMDSMPDHLREYATNPVFWLEELTLEIIRMRAYWVDGGRGGAAPGYRMRFSVLVDDGVVVEIDANGLTPEQVWGLFSRR
jgi:hypothetical protein